MAPDPGLLSSVQVAHRAGISYRRLDYWTRTGIVSATRDANGPGTQRGYTYAETQRVMTVAALQRLGLTLEAAAAAAEDPAAFAMRVLDTAPVDVRALVAVGA